MRLLPSIAAVALALGVAACSREDASQDGAAQPSASEEAAQADAPRAATYDPALRVDPNTIVWDSPEKKRQWEQRQAELAAQQQRAPAAEPPRQE